MLFPKMELFLCFSVYAMWAVERKPVNLSARSEVKIQVKVKSEECTETLGV